jgi:hypothetical protein
MRGVAKRHVAHFLWRKPPLAADPTVKKLGYVLIFEHSSAEIGFTWRT